jgi:hypothetical protein
LAGNNLNPNPTKLVAFPPGYEITNHAAKQELVTLLGIFTAYEGLLNGIKYQAEFDEEDHGRLSALSQVEGPLQA